MNGEIPHNVIIIHFAPADNHYNFYSFDGVLIIGMSIKVDNGQYNSVISCSIQAHQLVLQGTEGGPGTVQVFCPCSIVDIPLWRCF